MTLPIRSSVACLTATVALAVSGCSSSGGDGNNPPPGGSPTSSAPGSSPAGDGTLDAAAKQEITNAFKLFFNTGTSVSASEAVLQHGAKFRKTLAAESHSPNAQKVTATVSGIVPQGAKVASVTFSLVSGGQPLLPNTHGLAVLEDGKWKVAAQTFCSLLTLEGTAPDFCKDPSVTALPS